jgi:hypothetical protein
VLKVNETVNYNLAGSGEADRELTLGNPGWHYMPVLSECAVSIEDLFGDQLGSVIIIQELIGVNLYWADMSIYTLSELQPGMAYAIKVSSALTVEFPTCSFKSAFAANTNQLYTVWGSLNFAPSKQTTVFMNSATSSLQTGDVIGAFDSKDNLYGYATVEDNTGNLAMSLFGSDDMSTTENGFVDGDQVTFKLYRQSSDEYFNLIVNYSADLENVSGNFYRNSYAAITALTLKSENIQADQFTCNLYPNPAQDVVTIQVSGSGSSLIKVQVYDLNGRTVLEQEFVEHATLNVDALEAGIYSVKIFTDNDFSKVEKLIVR